jgi:hydrogenase maturation protein HypF
MVGLGTYNHFEAQLPMALEAIAEEGIQDCYGFEIVSKVDEPLQIDLSIMIKQIIADVNEGAGGVISAKFHNTIAAALLETAKAARESTKLNITALSGGVFYNRYLTNRLIKLLKKNDFHVLFNREFPSNDGGISVGQAAIAARIVNHGL